jgi:hypothetical protein
MIKNKYTDCYQRIITRAKTRNISGYTETHHIIPRSLGGDNSKENLVKLTAREHFICHFLLTKMYDGENKDKMIYAAWAMANLYNDKQQRYKINSRAYGVMREKYANLRSKSLKGKLGKSHSDETKKKISIMKLGKSNGPMSEQSKIKLSNSLKGKNKGKQRTDEQKNAQSIRQTGIKRSPASDETKKKISESLKGRFIGRKLSESTKKKMSDAQKGIPKTLEHRTKQSELLKGMKLSPEQQQNYLNSMKNGITVCEYCGKTNTKGNHIRWHGDKCKLKPQVSSLTRRSDKY